MGTPTIRLGQGQSLYVCPICGFREHRAGRFILVPEETRLYKGQEDRLPELCPQPHDVGISAFPMVWTPESSAHDLLGENFLTDLEGVERKFSSLTEVRNFERQSEQRARNGEGSPMIFRKLSQDHSNHDRNTLAGSSHERARAQTPSRRTVKGQPIQAGPTRAPD